MLIREDIVAAIAGTLLALGLVLCFGGCATDRPDYDGPAYPIEQATDPVTGRPPVVRVVP